MTKSKQDETPMSLKDNNIYLFMDAFTSESVAPVIEFILEKNLIPASKRPKNLTLIINSPGGDMAAAFALIDIMNGSSIPVHTLGIGQISSCGILTFMSGAKGYRVLTPNTSILSHQWSWGTYGKSHELMAVQKEFEMTDERMMAHYKRCTGLDEKTIKKVLLPPQDVWLTAAEAVKYGIADKIKKV
jgi:ATP-dependent Clp protease protease subunit